MNIKICPICQKQFRVKPSQYNKRTCCSINCYRKYQHSFEYINNIKEKNIQIRKENPNIQKQIISRLKQYYTQEKRQELSQLIKNSPNFTNRFSEKHKQKHKLAIKYTFDTTNVKEIISKKCQEIINNRTEEEKQQIVNKIINTKRINNTFNTSEDEEKIYQLLINKFRKNDIIRQYTSIEYPFACDFYIKSKQLYIEYQGSWTHGGKPFVNNEKCQKQLQKWIKKSSKFYQNAIETWTIRDVKKRIIAKENNLNWIEFFTLQEFLNWLNSLD